MTDIPEESPHYETPDPEQLREWADPVVGDSTGPAELVVTFPDAYTITPPPERDVARRTPVAVGELATASAATPAAEVRALPPVDKLPEWRYLHGDIEISPAAGTAPDTEALKTELSLACLAETYAGDAHRFALLDEPTKAELCAQTRSLVDQAGGLDAVAFKLLTHDSGKHQEVRDAVGAGPHVDTSTNQDQRVLAALTSLAAQNSLPVHTIIVAPGVDSPDYGQAILGAADAQRISLTPANVQAVLQDYATWRMDGSGSEEGRYGKTPLAWQLALREQYGLRPLDLPVANVTDSANPWRAFTDITPSMAKVVIMNILKLAAATTGKDTGQND